MGNRGSAPVQGLADGQSEEVAAVTDSGVYLSQDLQGKVSDGPVSFHFICSRPAWSQSLGEREVLKRSLPRTGRNKSMSM